MKILDVKLTRIGNSQGIRLPSELIKRYGFAEMLALETHENGVFLRSKKQIKLTWEETAKAMAASDEDWSDWDAADRDGLDQTPWNDSSPPASKNRPASRKRRKAMRKS